MRLFWVVLVGLILLVLGVLPMISVFVAGTIAGWAGCVLHEGFANPCMIGGRDWGSTLYTLFVLGWLGLATWPFAAAGLLLLAIAALLAGIRALGR
jgi:hypothetical protein